MIYDITYMLLCPACVPDVHIKCSIGFNSQRAENLPGSILLISLCFRDCLAFRVTAIDMREYIAWYTWNRCEHQEFLLKYLLDPNDSCVAYVVEVLVKR